MLDLLQVNWRRDSITRRYVAEHETELSAPESMPPAMLAEAATYCRVVTNPYAEELVKRAGLWKKYLSASEVERTNIVQRAAKSFNILFD